MRKLGGPYWCPACGTLTEWPGPGFVPASVLPLLVVRCREVEDQLGRLFRDRALELHWEDFITPLIRS